MPGSMLVMGISVFFEEVECWAGKSGLRCFRWGCARGNGSTRCRGTRRWTWERARPQQQVRMSVLRWWVEGTIEDGGERAPKRRRMKEPGKEGLIGRGMP